MPQAKLQPIAPRSILRTSPGPARATLSELVKVTTIISPHRTSAARAKGSNMRLEDLMCLSGIGVSKDRWPADTLRNSASCAFLRHKPGGIDAARGRCGLVRLRRSGRDGSDRFGAPA